jgi:hypothetical protein
MTTRREAMPKRAIVGKSGVTPCKHDLLNKLLGREVGVLTRNAIGVSSYGIVDLTAGDGIPYRNEFTKGCSPGIILKHAHFLAARAKRASIHVRVHLIEKQTRTYETLAKNVRIGWREVDITPVNNQFNLDMECADAKQFLFPPSWAEAAFLYNDPNHIEDWCLTPEILASAPKFTTSLSTLGCNVGGMKRLDLDRRELWFDRINLVTNSIVQPWHDACLLSVGGADQWAYLVTAPTKWRDRITADCLAAASKMEGREADPQVAWLKQDPAAFLALQQYLFLTKAENAQR